VITVTLALMSIFILCTVPYGRLSCLQPTQPNTYVVVDLFPRQSTMITKCALFGDLKIAAFFCRYAGEGGAFGNYREGVKGK